jgi:hypothetical protein
MQHSGCQQRQRDSGAGGLPSERQALELVRDDPIAPALLYDADPRAADLASQGIGHVAVAI